MADSDSPTPAKRPNRGISKEDEKVVRWLCQDLEHFDILDSNGFRSFYENPTSNYTLPSKKEFLDELVPAVYKKAESQLKIELQSVDYVAIALRKNKNYTNLRNMWTAAAYYVQEGKLVSQNLFTLPIPIDAKLPKTQQETRNKLKQHLNDWKILKKVVCFISAEENVKNIVKSWEDIPHISCTRAILLKTLENCINNLKENENFKAIFDKMQTEKKRETSLLQLRTLKNIAIKNSGEEQPEFAECVKMLDVFDDILEELSLKQTQTLSSVIPLIEVLKYEINKYSPSNDRVQEFKTNILSAIDFQFNFQDSLLKPDKALLLKATYLDPRFTVFSLTEKQANDVTQEVVKELVGMDLTAANYGNVPEENVEINDAGKGKLRALMEEKVNNDMKDKSFPTKLEVNMTVKIPKINVGEDPFKFWERHTHYKDVYNISKKYLCIPATATRVVSLPVKEYSDINRLEIVNELLFLHSFYSNEVQRRR